MSFVSSASRKSAELSRGNVWRESEVIQSFIACV